VSAYQTAIREVQEQGFINHDTLNRLTADEIVHAIDQATYDYGDIA
jgi:hypothetical protein